MGAMRCPQRLSRPWGAPTKEESSRALLRGCMTAALLGGGGLVGSFDDFDGCFG